MIGLGYAEILILGFLCVLFFVGILATVIGLLIFGSRRRPKDDLRDAREGARPSRRAPDDHDSRLDLVARITQRFCSCCRAPLAADSPQGLCPACLLSKGIESELRAGAVDGVAVTTPPSGSQPPLAGEIEDLQPNFPQLEILDLLGRGGMGAVYKARQKNLDRIVGLKVIPPEAAKDPTFTERFNREARALARLNHPNIVTVYDFGQAGNIYYLLMEYIDGVNLRQAQRAERLAASEALAIVPQICDALQYAHDQGVVHRDIKPENVLLDRSGRVKIADFGLAKLIGKGPDNFTLTGTLQVMGTPRYMAPEQLERPSAVDHRADIYSLGVVIYEMLTGELPVGRFPAPSERVEVDVRIDQVVLRTLEKEPERRYQRASQVKTELASAAKGVPHPLSEDVRPAPLAGAFAAVTPFPPPPQKTNAIEATPPDEMVVHRRVQGPAIGLTVIGLLGILLALLSACAAASLVPVQDEIVPVREEIEHSHSAAILGKKILARPRSWIRLGLLAQNAPYAEPTHAYPYGVFGAGVFFVLAVNLPVSVLIFIGGWRMRRLQSYGLAVTASVLSILPCTVVWIIALPLGLWSLVVLARPDVRAAFES